MIDVHCHLQFKTFENDYDAIIKDAFAEGVTTIINTGTQLSSSRKAVKFAEQYEKLYAIVGVHPHHADKIWKHPEIVEETERTQEIKTEPEHVSSDYWLKELEKLTKHPKVLAIGEIGIDYYSYSSNGIVDPKRQKEVFEAQIALAHRAKLPLQIHNRHAGETIIEILKHHKNLLLSNPGMFHCFAGTKEVLKEALKLGFSIGFDGNSTYKGLAPGETVELPELAKSTPLDRIVIETDAPYLTPIPHRGKRNEPKYVILTARFIAATKGISFEQLVEQTNKNVYTMFRKLHEHDEIF
ncbi:MAG TPA: TatD family hydrolase [Candidatus Sulfotelmatobacter sp.]|jgi:TatD DNase family protein|nr:TatD family hydrolase [Candidatus Sulfotelmatobacter sp.]